MTSYWPSWEAILDANAVGPLIRLLSPEIEDDILEAVAHIITQSTRRPSWPVNRMVIPSDTLQQLVDLLRSGRMELRLTATKVVQAVAKSYMNRTLLRKSSTVSDLCHLALNCRDLTEKKLVVSAISVFRNPFESYVNDVIDPFKVVINTQIILPLRDLLAHPSPKIVISACHVLGKSTMLMERRATIPWQLMPLLSHTDDEVFVEAIWTASDLVQNQLPVHHSTRLEDALSSAIPRLIRLLRHHEQQIVVSALRSIANAPSGYIYAYLLEMVDQGEVRLLIDLLKSSNLAVAEAALLVVRTIGEQYVSVKEYLVKHGVIQSLLHNLAFDPSPLFPETLDTLFNYMRDRRKPEDAHAIPFILQLLPTLHSPSIEKVLERLSVRITAHFPLDVTFVGSKIPRQLLQIAWHILDSGGSLSRIVQIICDFVLIYNRSTDEFRTAGAESFLSNPRLLPAISEQGATGNLAKRIQNALRRLRGNIEIDVVPGLGFPHDSFGRCMPAGVRLNRAVEPSSEMAMFLQAGQGNAG